MKFTFITALDYLSIPQKIECKVGFDNSLSLTNDTERVSALIEAYHASCMGELEHNHLLSGRPVVYVERDVPGPHHVSDMLVDFLREVQSLLGELWLWKDNSINCQQAFALAKNMPSTSSNCLPVFNSSATGEDINTRITADEFVGVIKSRVVQIDSFKESNIPRQTSIRKSTGRLNVALYHLQNARNNRDLGFKIANYCSFFEALFSTDTAELSHQLSQRISFFLHDCPNKRLEMYRMTKKAYAVRSKTVHGDMLDSSISNLRDISLHCDDIARGCLMKIFKNQHLFDIFNSHSKEKVSNYLVEMVFGVS
ncbi:hypothetical protein A9179_02450 [Pseudomonas alcaligenes]|uniref:Apea-like HEPN domain-containing protein n=1 Tax=Aquipseudomonas alcaligenes TaxID=43263 RepID=A0ABR7RV65_AQUAC|nr:HEPN domain-containing protein [Pseudomonas alcaligenes]MBC9249130.1 hypothetical protein [Pseudomonas alcaligenes]